MATSRSSSKSGGLHAACKLIASAAAVSLLGACANSGASNQLLTRSIGARTTDATHAYKASATSTKDVAYWENELKKNLQNADAALNLAKTLKTSGAKRRAFAVLRNAALQHPNNVAIASEFGRLAVELNQFAAAESILAPIDTAKNRDWRVISARGTIRAKQGKHRKARAFYERALEVAPNEPSILNNIALTYAFDGKPERAESLLRQAADKSNSSKRVTENLALILGLQGRFGEAGQISKKSLPTEIADSNLDFLRRMVRVAKAPANVVSDSRSATTKAQRIALSDPAPQGVRAPKHTRAANLASTLQATPAAKKAKPSRVAKPKPDSAPASAKKRTLRKTIFGEFKYPAQVTRKEKTPKRPAHKSASRAKPVMPITPTKPNMPRKATKTPKPAILTQWTTKLKVEKKPVAVKPKPVKENIELGGTIQSGPNHVLQLPMPLFPAPDQKNVGAFSGWTTKVSLNKDEGATNPH